MTRDDMIKLAREADLTDGIELQREIDAVMRFAALVAAAEREKCADELFNDGWGYAAKTIRARGQG